MTFPKVFQQISSRGPVLNSSILFNSTKRRLPSAAGPEWWHFKSSPLQAHGLFASQGCLHFTLARQWSGQITSFSLFWARWSLSLRVMTRGTYSPNFMHLNSSVVLIGFVFLEKLSPNFSSASKSPGGLVKIQISVPHSQSIGSVGQCGSWEFAFLKQVARWSWGCWVGAAILTIELLVCSESVWIYSYSLKSRTMP